MLKYRLYYNLYNSNSRFDLFTFLARLYRYDWPIFKVFYNIGEAKDLTKIYLGRGSDKIQGYGQDAVIWPGWRCPDKISVLRFLM